ncbi:unnamed protein product, partial [Ectocarpus sp. 13 AM-2016]
GNILARLRTLTWRLAVSRLCRCCCCCLCSSLWALASLKICGALGDGNCDKDNNTEECDYDRGDCCSCTCQVPDDSSGDDGSLCGESAVFACIDPDAPCVNDDDYTAFVPEVVKETCGGNFVQLADGDCDQINNNEECGYDGGDCCSCTCLDDFYECGSNGFACIDPSAECVDDDDVTVDMVENCDVRNIGDGQCDLDNNREECHYDGGDCCSCTCQVPEDDSGDDGSLCSESVVFACIDPDAPCVNDDDITVDMVDTCGGYPVDFGDGWCDDDNNNEECGYDSGDCCSCTCVDGTYECGIVGFDCVDPSAECVDDGHLSAGVTDDCGDAGTVGDGYCDLDNNREECAYDGGDCCECTCETFGLEDGSDSCTSGFDCQDPTAPCFGEEPILPEHKDDDGSMSYE